MDSVSDQKNNLISPPPYSTPFNVDFFLYKSKGEFTNYVRRVLSLSESIQNVLTDPSTAEFIEEKLGQTFGLSSGQKTELTRILRNVLLADLFWGDFPSLISSRLGVDANTANQIVKMISDELLAPALEEIKTMQKSKFGDRIAQSRTDQIPQAPQNANADQGNVINLRNQR